ncbi:hypothetical protein [Micromonospora sp. NPDC005806]
MSDPIEVFLTELARRPPELLARLFAAPPGVRDPRALNAGRGEPG